MPLESLKDSKVLIVGGAGFVGSNLAKKILEHDPQSILVIDNLLSADIRNIPESPKIKFIWGSITEEKVLKQIPQDTNVIFQLATYHGNQSSMHDPLADHDNNTYTSLRILEAVKDFKELKAFVYSSAGCTVAQKTFDEAKPTTEDDPVSLYLDSPYQISKIIGEFYGNYYWKQHNIPFVKARFQNVYGPGEILGAGRWRGTPATVWRNVTPTFIWNALNKQALPVENGGIATRDFIYVDDIAQGLICCALKGQAGGVYNLSSGVETSIKELAETINELTQNPTPIALKPARTWDRSGKRYGDTSKSEKEIAFKAKTNLRDGLKTTIEWTIENKAMIEACINQHKIFMDK
jgi:nucleoside-diphosphate-sugar epimerase